jgi:heme/copper-type cytochrome/quinol oxidase subunit 2
MKFARQAKPVHRWLTPVAFAAAALLVLFLPVGLVRAAPTERTIRIGADMYRFTPGELRVNPGDRITLELVSTDVVHGLSLEGHDFDLQADPGQTAVGTFVAGQPGAYRFRCSVACGSLHPFMIGMLRVGPNLLLLRGIGLGVLAVAAAFWSASASSGRRFSTSSSLPGSG